MDKIRCDWAVGNELLSDYHDTEWGVALHDDKKHYEFILLDGFQAGLSWLTILKKRENLRKAFSDFDVLKIAEFVEEDFNRLMNNHGIIRNKLKINAAITNARQFLEIQAKYGSFDNFIWKFTDGKTIQNEYKSIKEVPAKTPLSDKMSKELLSYGFKFVGSTICYAYMQAAGMVNDHLTTCFRYLELKNN